MHTSQQPELYFDRMYFDRFYEGNSRNKAKREKNERKKLPKRSIQEEKYSQTINILHCIFECKIRKTITQSYY